MVARISGGVVRLLRRRDPLGEIVAAAEEALIDREQCLDLLTPVTAPLEADDVHAVQVGVAAAGHHAVGDHVLPHAGGTADIGVPTDPHEKMVTTVRHTRRFRNLPPRRDCVCLFGCS